MEFFTGLFVVVYFIIGFGVFNMWKQIVNDDYGIIFILFWPLISITNAFYNRKD
ncbi:hypothetical protein MAELSTROM_63 [Pseudoalteromonas phage Maelstrom]|uniref:hypothetical protein n=1 Tax=Pseudoalteromonas phage Maelstrom TaxID=2065202 RepID=UPI000CA113C0|nr:hypothetical protein PP584_gp63 [Pseudoalteromonas phage Maelstrom]AUG84982.1 hypothetical protein MAELSTROM_63 [Pseudoalteromonas phage Maelstrom]